MHSAQPLGRARLGAAVLVLHACRTPSHEGADVVAHGLVREDDPAAQVHGHDDVDVARDAGARARVCRRGCPDRFQLAQLPCDGRGGAGREEIVDGDGQPSRLADDARDRLGVRQRGRVAPRQRPTRQRRSLPCRLGPYRVKRIASRRDLEVPHVQERAEGPDEEPQAQPQETR